VIFPQNSEEMVWVESEIRGLLDTMGVLTQAVVPVYLREPSPRYLVGTGKAEEIFELAQSAEVELIVIDHELSPSQQRNWEQFCGIPVIDRHEVILEIFAQRAQTREAVLQVALARLEYSLPRLTRKWTDLSQQRGGSARTRGAGETQLELDRRKILNRIDRIKQELKEVQKHRAVTRKGRKENLMTTAAIVGYTNAGKSTLLKTLTDANVLVENKLFATLDPVTRRLSLAPGQDLLVTDTVGFVSRLPHQLVDAFRSTLEESLEADFLIHVVDVSDHNFQHRMSVVEEVLQDLKRSSVPILTVLNKIDLLPPQERALLEFRFPEAVFTSLTQNLGLETLKSALLRYMEKTRVVLELALPLERVDLVRLLHHQALILSENYQETMVEIRALCPPALKGKLQHYLVYREEV